MCPPKKYTNKITGIKNELLTSIGHIVLGSYVVEEDLVSHLCKALEMVNELTGISEIINQLADHDEAFMERQREHAVLECDLMTTGGNCKGWRVPLTPCADISKDRCPAVIQAVKNLGTRADEICDSREDGVCRHNPNLHNTPCNDMFSCPKDIGIPSNSSLGTPGS